MAIAFGTFTLSHTSNYAFAPTGAATIMFVAHEGDSSDNFTTATHNGKALTLINKIQETRWYYLFYRISPDTSGNIVINGSTSKESAAWYYTGALQTGSPEASNSSNSTSVSVTTLTASAWLVGMGHNGSAPPTATSGISRGTWGASSQNIAMDSNASLSIGAHTLDINSNSPNVMLAASIPAGLLSQTVTDTSASTETLSNAVTVSNTVTDTITSTETVTNRNAFTKRTRSTTTWTDTSKS